MQERKAMRWWKGPLAILAFLFVLVLGCKTPPNVKPPKEPEVLNFPPDLAKYSVPGWPAEVVDRDDKTKPKTDPYAGGGMPKGGGGSGASMMPAGGMNQNPSGSGYNR